MSWVCIFLFYVCVDAAYFTWAALILCYKKYGFLLDEDNILETRNNKFKREIWSFEAKHKQSNKCNTLHYSSECCRNPAHLKTQEWQKKIMEEQDQDATIKSNKTLNTLSFRKNLNQQNL